MTRSTAPSIRSSFVAGFVTVVLLGQAAIAAHVVNNGHDGAIGVHDGRYVTGGQTYTTLDALEAAVRSARPSALLIVACTPAAIRSWLAAVPCFEDFPMHLDVSDGSSPACAATLPVSTVPGAASAELDPVVRQYWDQHMP
jgi:hypothetical protein